MSPSRAPSLSNSGDTDPTDLAETLQKPIYSPARNPPPPHAPIEQLPSVLVADGVEVLPDDPIAPPKSSPDELIRPRARFNTDPCPGMDQLAANVESTRRLAAALENTRPDKPKT